VRGKTDLEKIKIWWQSSTVIADFPEFLRAIENHAKMILSPNTELEVHGVDFGTSELQYHYFSFLNTHQILENAWRAQQEGFDAVAIGCGMDPGLDEAREILDIPVLGMSETGMLVACMLGRKFSVITHNYLLNKKRIELLIQKYGLESRSVSGGTFEVDLNILARSFNNPEPVISQFTTAAMEAIHQGAEVIIPGCNILSLVAAQNKFYEINGIPILDVSGVLMKITEAMVMLNRISGVRISRKGYFEPPSSALTLAVRKIYEED